MPTYEYYCKSCGNEFEDILRVSDREDPTKEPCKECQAMTISIKMSSPATISPFALSGLKKPRSDFKDRMKQIKTAMKYDKSTKLKDY